MTGPDEPRWTPGALARRLGISPTTLRTWDRRYGLGPSAHEDGRHRRYSDSDARRLQRMITLTGDGMSAAAAAALARTDPAVDDLPAQAAEVAQLRPHRAAIRGFLKAAARLDAPHMRQLTSRLIADHGVVAAWEGVFVPVLVELGAGNRVEVEHMASASILQTLRQLPVAAEEGRLRALLACAPEDQHTLALEALAAALSEQGHAYRSLGARVPPDALLETVCRLRPAATVVWAYHADTAALVPAAELLAGGHTEVIAAGPGWASVEIPEGVREVFTLSDAVEAVVSTAGRGGLPASG